MRMAVTRIVLVVTGAVLGLIGGALVLVPKQFLEMSHVFVDHDPSLMSEISAPAGILLFASALMIVGAIQLRFANLALAVGAIVYGSYGIGRVFSMLLHGLPSESLITATMIELGAAALLITLKLVNPSTAMPSVLRGSPERLARTV